MTTDTLAFRISRRAIGSAGLDAETLRFSDRRYLGSNADRAINAACEYVLRLVSELQPRQVALFAPTNSDGVTRAIANRLQEAFTAQEHAVEVLGSSDLMAAFGIGSLRSRAELRNAVLHIWPDGEAPKRPRPNEVAEAAAVALLAQVRSELRSIS